MPRRTRAAAKLAFVVEDKMALVDEFGCVSVSVANFKCFGDVGGELGRLSSTNIIIGRNNSGKSAIIDVLRVIASRGQFFDQTKHSRSNSDPRLDVSIELTEQILQRVFSRNTSGGDLPQFGNFWQYGQRFLGRSVVVRYDMQLRPVSISGIDFPEVRRSEARQGFKEQLMRSIEFPLKDIKLLDIAAERDVRPEPSSPTLALQSNGDGLTNLVRAFINRDDLPRDQIEIELLRELNEVYKGDCVFTRISCREAQGGLWEIFLEESEKGLVRLSQSGSSLKSVFIVLCQLRLTPLVSKVDLARTVFVVEEPENNLHPSLLRRLLEFLAVARERCGLLLVVATHSPIAIDWASRRADANIIHVTHAKGLSAARRVKGYLEKRDVLDDLDIRASDILQANGIIWVEGPSDRIYVRRWLELVSDGQLKEGVHYSVLFYGGRLLSHLTALPPGERDELVNTLSINRNAALIIDSDRHLGTGKTKTGRSRRPRMNVNETKQRLRTEIEEIGGLCWITEGREIENYLSPRILGLLVGEEVGQAIGEYEDIPEHQAMQRYKRDKIAIANAAVGVMDAEDLGRMDLSERVDELAERVRRWNAL